MTPDGLDDLAQRLEEAAAYVRRYRGQAAADALVYPARLLRWLASQERDEVARTA